jgi:protein O-mannosyl-transferase
MSSEQGTFISESRSRDSRLALIVGFFLFMVTLAVYWPVSRFEFVNFDDQGFISDNPQVRAGLTLNGFLWAFQHGVLGNWHPLTTLSHMLDCQLFGMNAGGHHLTSLLFHIANTLLLFGVLRQMTATVWRSAFVAGLFALHPLHVESVVWVAERKDVLSTFFFMLTLWAYVRYAQKGRAGSPLPAAVTDSSGAHGVTRPTIEIKAQASPSYWLALFFFALGLMSKPMLVTLPFVLLLLDYWPLRRVELSTLNSLARRSEAETAQLSTVSHLLLEKLPFLLLAAALAVMTLGAQKQAGAVASLTLRPLGFRLANALTSYTAYLRKLVWPDDLAVFYPYPASFSAWEIALSGLLLLAVSVAVMAASRRRPWLAVGWLWYVGTLVPVIGLVTVGSHSMADRYTYIPLIGLFVMIAWGLPEPMSRWGHGGVILIFGAAVALVACAVGTTRQLGYWQNDFRLFEHALAVTRNNAPAHFHVAVGLMERGREAEAMQHYATALRIDPSHKDVHYNLGNYYRRQGKLEEAKSHFLAELRVSPRHVLARNNLGIVLAAQNKTDEAIEYFKAVLAIQPDGAEAHNNLANVLAAKGKSEEAIAHYLAALRLRPDYAEAHLNLARLYDQQNQLTEAAAHFASALVAMPNDAGLHIRLGSVFAKQNRTAEAIRHYREALRLSPDNGMALNNLAWLLATHPDPGFRDGVEAVRLARSAAELAGNKDAQALDTLAAAFAEASRYAEAIHAAQRALDLAQVTGETNLAREIQLRLQKYMNRQPIRDNPTINSR